MPGQNHESIDSLCDDGGGDDRASASAACCSSGFRSAKDAQGSGAFAEDGVVQESIRALRERFGDACVLIADCCLCEYTDHGHCGFLLDNGTVDNDATLELYARTAVAQAAAGADIIAPSGMMDGQVAAIRDALDSRDSPTRRSSPTARNSRRSSTGPFRDAAECAPRSGDRRSYQMDPANQREAVREAILDVEEGADMVMVKPALTYLDVVARVRDATDLPLAAYCVSGEFAMLHHAAAAGAFDERAAVLEALGGIRRAGADMIITYHARAAAGWLAETRSRSNR